MQDTGKQKGLRVHRQLVEAIVSGLKRIFLNAERSDKVVHEIIRSDRRWGSRDRNFIASAIFDITRFRRKYWNDLGETESSETPALIRLWGAYQLRIGMAIPDWPEFKNIGIIDVAAPWKVVASVADETDNIGRIELGNEMWERSLDAMNIPASLFVRANTLKTSVKKLSDILIKEGIESRIEEGDCVCIIEKKKLNESPSHKKGMFEIQDRSSQLVAPYLELESEMLVGDICAGGGGKTLHLSALMKNRGKIIATDISAGRLANLEKRAERAGLKNVEIIKDIAEVFEKYSGQFDRLLIDAPCSGSGTIRREPEKKYRINVEMIRQMSKTQSEILDKAAILLKPGGKMVYATCSIFPSENRKSIDDFLNAHSGFELEAERSIMPYDLDSDGFYMARLTKRA